MDEGEELARLLRRDDLPPWFERWHVEFAPLEQRSTSAEEWDGAVVLVERGRLEVDCETGGRRTFGAGDILALGALPLRRLANRGESVTRLVAIRRTRRAED
ncbi:hypothetical protein BH23CHL7_BH23CHL7_07360 [soil metagenome]